jgi:hypothetical protein
VSNFVRILVVIACVIAFYYLVVTLARSVREEDTGRLAPAAPAPEEDASMPRQIPNPA